MRYNPSYVFGRLRRNKQTIRYILVFLCGVAFSCFGGPWLNLSFLYRSRPVVACIILSAPKYWESRVPAVRRTWAPRCDTHNFYYSRGAQSAQLPGGVGLKIPEGRAHLTGKVLQAFNHSYLKSNGAADWYMKADDDSYVIMENVKHVLSRFPPYQPYYIGQWLHLRPGKAPSGYHSGGAGYVLSREAVRRLVKYGWTHCVRDGRIEDVHMGACMKKLNVTMLSAVDDNKRLSFHSYNPQTWLNPKEKTHKLLNYRDIVVNPKGEAEALSVSTATLHYMRPWDMYMFDYLIYDLCVTGQRSCTPASFTHQNMITGKEQDDES